MYYKFNRSKLIFEKTNISSNFIFGLGVILGLLFIMGLKHNPPTTELELSYEDKLIIIREYNEFSEERLFDKIKELNFKFPHIVAAQAIQETGNYTSGIFLENNNLFGMKQATSRATSSQGTNRNHAYYDSWQESLYDYALFYNAYLRRLQTQEHYYQYLHQNYAEDTSYVSKLKQIIVQHNLEEKFK
jgi:uncharacterized FlgJ-related protein